LIKFNYIDGLFHIKKLAGRGGESVSMVILYSGILDVYLRITRWKSEGLKVVAPKVTRNVLVSSILLPETGPSLNGLKLVGASNAVPSVKLSVSLVDHADVL